MTIEHRATYYIPGTLFPETVTKKLDARSVDEAVSKAPSSAYCFELFDVLPPPDLGPEFSVTSKPLNKSARFFIGGKLFTVEEVEREYPELGILASNMRCNDYKVVIRCRTGNWQPFQMEDTLLPDPEEGK